jgi:hypothetical protein
MRLRILVFLVFQIVAWTIYFNSGKIKETGLQRTLQVKEIKGEENNVRINEIDSYKLVLRNDGLFTKVMNDHVVESGLWSVNYDIPSLILKSPSKEYKFKIVKYNGADLEIMLINQHEIENVAERGNKKAMDKLFSSIKNN